MIQTSLFNSAYFWFFYFLLYIVKSRLLYYSRSAFFAMIWLYLLSFWYGNPSSDSGPLACMAKAYLASIKIHVHIALRGQSPTKRNLFRKTLTAAWFSIISFKRFFVQMEIRAAATDFLVAVKTSTTQFFHSSLSASVDILTMADLWHRFWLLSKWHEPPHPPPPSNFEWKANRPERKKDLCRQTPLKHYFSRIDFTSENRSNMGNWEIQPRTTWMQRTIY